MGFLPASEAFSRIPMLTLPSSRIPDDGWLYSWSQGFFIGKECSLRNVRLINLPLVLPFQIAVRLGFLAVFPKFFK